ncbi:autotransporter-associated beta strand repeat-containing protein [Mesorhizobium sp. B2-3-4]|uniref:autotransporter-associated beta strand repeat-containing protein n=1 Tax=Mesorhizobium sp. B2-3-4 TaxID=2589959 RepID=UPI0015E2E298|nr:autotransporter-associated beta strand repeat-containing protein [Mesorhizobium sp. B2-3-4]
MTKWKGEAASFAPYAAQLALSAARASAISLLPAAMLMALAAGMAVAADRYWDPNSTATGTGGTGTWNVSANQWSPNADGVSGPYTPWSNAALDNAIFGGVNGTTATVTLGAPVTANSLTINANTTYTVTGNTLTLAGATPTITVNGAATISSIIAGSAGLTKTGAGSLVLSGANTFSGGVNLTGGLLLLNDDSSLGAASNGITLSSGANLRTTGALAASRVVTLLSGTAGIGGGVGSAHFTGAGGISLIAQTVMSDDSNDFTGAVSTDSFNLYFSSIGNLGEASALGAATTVANGTVFVRNAAAVYTGSGDTSNRSWNMAPSAGSSVLTNQGTGTLTVTGDMAAGGGFAQSVILNAQTADLAVLGVISSNLATRPFIFTGGGTSRTVTLGGANTFGGPVTIQTVTVKANSLANQGVASALGSGSFILLNTGVLSYTGAAASMDRAMSINGASAILNDGTGSLALSGATSFNTANPGDTLTLGGSFAGSNTFSGGLSGNGNLVMNGAAGSTWVLSGANSYVGSTTVTSGTLRAGNATAFGAPNAVIVNGGTLDLNGFDTTATSFSGTGGSVTLNGADLTVNSAASTSYAGVIADGVTGGGGLIKRGTSTLTLTGANTYSGDTTVNGGTLALNFAAPGAPASNIISGASGLNMAGGVVTLTGAAGVANSQTFDGLNVSAGNNQIVTTAGAGGSMTLNLGAITHTGGLLDFTLPTSGTITTTNGDGALSWATVNGTDYAQVSSGLITAFTAYANKDNASTWLTGDVVSDAGGAPNTPFTNTVSGNVQLGGLKYTAAANSIVTVGAGNTLGVDGTIIISASVNNASQTITGGSITGAAGGGTLGVLDNSTGTGTFTIQSAIVDNGGATSFAKGGAGKVALTGANSYTGGTTISGGTLAIDNVANGGSASSIGASSADSANLVLESGTLQYTGVGAGTTDRGFTLVNGGAPRTIQVDSGNLSFGGVVVGSDDAGFSKTGAGTLTLANAANTYTGATTISGGILSVNTLANGGVASGIGASSSDAANLVIRTGGTLQYTGATTSTDRGLTLSGIAGGTIDVANAATTLTVGGTVVGAVPFHKAGAGTLVFSGTNSNTGPTFIDGGTLRAGSTQAFGGPAAMNLADAAGVTLDLAGFNNKVGGLSGGGANGGTVRLGGATLTIGGTTVSFNGAITGAGGITKDNTSTQTFVGCNNTYTGATNVIGGTLSVDCLANGGQASGIGASTSASANLGLSNGILAYTGGSVAIDRGITLVGIGAINVVNASTVLGISGPIVGAGLRKDGAGTLVLSGNNTYTGITTVTGGILRAGSSTAIGAGGFGLNNTAGVALDLNNFNTSISYLNGGGAIGGNITLGTATLTIASNVTAASFAGAISGSGGLIKGGTVTQALTGCASSYTGTTTVRGGVLQVSCLADGGVNSTIGASSNGAANLVLTGGTLQYVGAGDSTDRLFTLGASAGSRLESSGTGAIAFTNTGAIAFSAPGTSQALALGGTNTGNNSLAAQITNNAAGVTSLTKDGAGTWILNNQNSTYTGVTTINGGVLGVSKLANGGQASSLGASSNAASNLVIGNGSTLRYTGAGDTTDRLFTLSAGTSFIESSGSGAIVFSNTGSATYSGTGNRTLALGGTNTGLNTMGGTIIDGPGGQTTLAKNDAGTWVLTGNNTFTGNTVINGGNLMIGNGGTSGNAGAGNVIITDANSTLSFNRSDIFNFTGTINPDPQAAIGTIAQIGTGTTVLTATNKIGATAISAGTLQVNGALTTPTIAMTGTGALTVNGTVGAGAGGFSAIIGDGGASTITIATGGTLRGNGDLGAGNDTVNVSGTLDTGAAKLNLGAGNDTLVLNDSAVFSGAGVDAGTGGETGAGDTLQVVTAAGSTLDAANVSNFESLSKQGAGTLTLTGNHAFSGGTTISGGTLQIGNGAVAGALTTPGVTNNGTLVFNLNNDYVFNGAISGTGAVNKLGTGVTTLTGNNSYAGATNVNAGTLLVNGNQSGATGPTTVAAGATLGGTGTIGGSVTVADGGTLAPGAAGNSPGTLTIAGNLALGNSNLKVNFGQADVVGGPLNDAINVGGNLTLDGTLNVTQSPGGTLGPGIYRVISYNGSLTDNGLNVTDANYFVQTSVANQVNLVNSTGLTLSYWDGDAGPHSDGVVNGGNGSWQAAGDQNWTDIGGVFAAPFANGSFAVFQGTAGTVTVDNTNGQVQAAGMQFASNGYVVQGAGIELVGGSSTIRVGDGTAAGAGYTATIAANLGGNSQLVKTDAGTLVLSGTNSYQGGTAINGGTLRIASDTNLGAALGGLSFNGGTLNTTADVTSTRAVTLAGAGTFQTNAGTTTILTGSIAGTGTLTKAGAGTLVLTVNSYQGGTVINGGTVEIQTDAGLGDAAGKVSFDGGTLHVTGTVPLSTRDTTLNAGGGTITADNSVQWAGTISGSGALTAGGSGFLTLDADNTYAGGTTIVGGVLQLGSGGTTGSILGDVVNNGSLGFKRSDLYSFDGLISGSGQVIQAGTGITVLTADNTYAGTTGVADGSLYIDGDQSAATGLTTVSNATLGGNGTIGGDVSLSPNSTLSPGGVGATPGTLTINGNLRLGGANLDYSFGQAGVVGGAYNDLTVVHGDLVLSGTINVTEAPGGNFGLGIYRVISYDGLLTDQGPSTTSPDYSVQTSIDHQVNLVNTGGQLLNFWDGAAGPKADGTINGGDGTWQNSAGNDNWTLDDGTLNAPYQNGVFAIFAGTAGTVSVDNSLGDVHSGGMQFATGGYTIGGNDITLDGPQSTIRVGDGTLPGAAYVATINSNLTGASQLVKTDLGTLVLGGANSYIGGTAINQGTLQISDDANLGDAAGDLSLDGGTTLHTTAAFASARDIALTAGTGTFQADADLTLSGLITGAGGLAKTGNGALTLTGANSYAAATNVTAGGLYVDGDNSAAIGAVSVAGGATLGGKGTIGGDVTIADGATLSPGSADGTPGTLAIAGNLNLSSGSVLNYSFGQADVAGGALNDLTKVGGNLVLDGTLNVTASAGGTFGPGVYRVFSYDGTLTNNGLVVGTIPSTGYSIQTSIDHQVNLVNTEGLTFNYWDGAAGPKNNGVVNGGDGIWQSAAGNDNWANEAGTANAGFADQSFAIFAGQTGTVMVDASVGQVTASGMQFMTDGYVVQGDGIELVGPSSSIVVGDGTAAGAAMTATIASVLSGDAQLVKSDRGTLVLSGANSYKGGTAVNGGTLQVSQDANLGDAAGALSFDGGTLATTGSFATSRAVNVMSSGTISTAAGTTLTLNGALTGSGTFNKAGQGTLLLTAADSVFAGPTAVQQGTLQAGAVNVLGAGSAFAVASGATLDLGGFNQTVASLNNSGSVRLGSAPGTTLTVSGNYDGAGGTVFLNAALDGDGSTTDKMVVHGNTSGTGILAVTNVGGAGAQTVEGIKIVDVDGSSAGTFTLQGDYVFQGDQAVVGGAYAYRLYKNGVSAPSDGDWYLRSQLIDGSTNPLYSPAVPIYEAYPGVLQSLNEVSTLQQRTGNRSWTGASQGADEIGSVPTQSAIWARIEAAHTTQSPESATTVSGSDVTTWKLQSGIDGLLYEDATGILLGGVTFHYGTASSDISSIYGSGSIQATGYGFGGTLTWYGDNGFYTDAQAEVTWYDSDLKSGALGDLAKGNNGFGYALSIEAGQKFALDGKWTLTPQAQLAYSSVRFSSFTDPFDAAVSLGGSDVLTGRAGLSLDHEDAWTGAEGKVGRSHLYGIANLYYDFLDGNDVDVSGTALHDKDQALWGGLGVGGSLSWDDDRYAVFGEAFARSSLRDFGDSRSIGAKLGFNVKW